MQVIFGLVAIGGGIYFLLAKRPFDYFSLAFFSSIIYFMPGFFGETAYHVGGVWNETIIHSEAYGVMIAVMSSVWFFAWCSSRLPILWKINWAPPATNCITYILLLATMGGLGGLLLTAGGEVFNSDKDVVLESLGRWHILFYVAATIGFPFALHKKQYHLAASFILFLSFDLFIGFRSAFAISVISALIVHLYGKGRQRLILNSWKIILVALFFGVLMFGYKAVSFAVKAGMWDIVWSHLQDINTYLFMLTRSEPFVVQQTLNDVIAYRFETSVDHILSGFYQFLLFAPELGVDNVSFNSLFQAALFPEVEYGFASNIWAQMWSAGGWPLLMLFIVIFNIVLMLGNATLRARSAIFSVGLAPAFCYWAFYIHRNDLGYALNLEKRQLLLLVTVVVAASIVRAATVPAVGSAVMMRSESL